MNELQEKILKSIRARGNEGLSFKYIVSEAAQGREPDQNFDRFVDREIQKMRKAGKIVTRKQRWHIA